MTAGEALFETGHDDMMVGVQPLQWQNGIDGLSDGIHPLGLFFQGLGEEGERVAPLAVKQHERVSPPQTVSTPPSSP